MDVLVRLLLQALMLLSVLMTSFAVQGNPCRRVNNLPLMLDTKYFE